jgi:plastocyanin
MVAGGARQSAETAASRGKTMRSLLKPMAGRVNLYVLTLLALLTFVVEKTLAQGPTPYVVSQRGRDFQPNRMSIKQGDTIRIVNDDADLLHHAYVSSEKFKFDSGDMEPGRQVDVKFSVPGDFNVLCGIHPKMKLVVHVEEQGR